MTAMTRGDGPESLYAKMLAEPGDTLALVTTRAPEAIIQQRDGDLAAISKEAFDELMENARMWVGTRMLRFYERTGRGAHNVTIEMKVSTTGPLEPGGEPARVVRMSVVDGKIQLEALR